MYKDVMIETHNGMTHIMLGIHNGIAYTQKNILYRGEFPIEN
jgi:hypothetical protein